MLTAGALNQVYTGTAVTPVLPSHTTGDILIAVGMHNGAGTLAVSGWTQIAAENNANLSSGAWYKVAVSGAESNPVITSSGSATSALGLFAQTFKAPGTAYTHIGTAIWNGPTSSTTPTGSTVVTTGASALAVTFGLVDTANAYASGLPPASWTTVSNDSSENFSVPTVAAVSSAIAIAQTGTTLNVTLPSHQADDILVVVAAQTISSGTLTCGTSGWAKLDGTANAALSTGYFWKRATSASETTPTITTTNTASGTDSLYAVAFVIRGCITTGNPYDEFHKSTMALTASPTTTSTTTAGFDRLLFAAFAVNDNNTFNTVPTDWSEHLDINTITGSDVQFGAMSRTVATPSTIGAATWTNSASDTVESITIAFIPATAGEGRITTIEQVKATPGTVSGATIATLPSAAYWKSLSVTLEPTGSSPQTVDLASQSITSAESVSNPAVSPGPRTITLTGNEIASAESVSSPTITKRNTITLSTGQEIASAESVSQPTITKRNTITLNSINSSEAFENPTVRGLNRISVQNNSINSNEFHETFNGSNGVLGNGWLQRPLDGNAVYGNITIASNAAVGDSDTEGAWAYNPDFNHAANCEIWFDVASVSGGFVVEIEFATNNPDSTNWSGYSFDITQTGESWFYRVDNTSYTQIGYFTGATLAAGDRVRIKNNGGTLTADRYRNGSATFLVSAVDSTYGVGSGIGLYIDGNTGISIDNLWVSSIDTNSVNNPTITQGSITQTIVLTGHEIASAESVSNPTLTKLNTIALNAINSGEAFENPTVSSRFTISTHSFGDSYGPEVLKDSPLWYNRYENGAVAGSLYDHSNNTQPNVVSTAVAVTAIDGPLSNDGPGQGLQRTNDQLGTFLAGTPTNQPSTAITVEIWFKTNVQANWPNWVNAGWVSDGAYLLYASNVGPIFGIINPTATQNNAVATKTYNDDKWHHVVGTYNGSAIILYYDGIAAGTVTGVNTQNITLRSSGGISFGAGVTSGTANYRALAEYATYGTALSPARILAHYEAAFDVPNATVGNRNTITLNTSINSAEAFDSPTITSRATITFNSINSAEAFDNPTITKSNTIALNAINSSEAFDNPTITNRATITLNSVNSAETFDNPTITSRNSIVLTGNEINSTEGVSNPSLSSRATISASSIDSLEAFGNPQLSIVITGSINSAESVSSPTVTSLRTIILTGNEIASAESVSNPTLVKFNTIAPNSVNSAEAFDNPTLTHRATIILTGNEIGSAENVSQPTVSNARTIVLTGQEIGSGFAADNPTVSSRATIAPNSINSAEAFDNPTIQKLNTIVLNSINSAESVNNPIVVNVNTIVPNSINSSEVVDNPSISNLATIVLNSINSAESVNNPTVLNQNTISVNSIDSAEAFSNPNVLPIFPVSITSAEFVDQPVILTGAFLIQPNAIDSAESVNNPTITTGGVTIALNSVNSGEAFENPIVTSLRVITLNSINSSETFDNPVVSNKNTITPNSIASSEVVNNPIVLNLATIILNSIASSEAVDNPNVTTRTTINLSSYDGSDTPNNPVVSTFNLISLNSVNSAESVNNPIVSSSSIVNLNPINPDEIVNEIVLTTLSQIYPETFGGDTFSTDLEVFLVVPGPQGAGGISSLEALGLPRIGFGINPNSITSEEVVSSPFIVSPITIWIVNPISSSEGFGSVIITNNRIQPISGISVSGTSIVYPPVHSAGGTGVVIIGSAIVVPSPGTPANPGGSVTIGTVEGVRTPLL